MVRIKIHFMSVSDSSATLSVEKFSKEYFSPHEIDSSSFAIQCLGGALSMETSNL